MTLVYHGTIEGIWDLSVQQKELAPIKPQEISDFIEQAASFVLGYSDWFDRRLNGFLHEEGKVYVTDSKEMASRYSTRYPEILTSCINRLRDEIEEGHILTERLHSLTSQLKNLHSYFQRNSTPIVATLEIPESALYATNLPNEFYLLKTVNIKESLINIEQSVEPHSFFFFYDRLVQTINKKGVIIPTEEFGEMKKQESDLLKSIQ